MAKRTTSFDLASIVLDPAAAQPLYNQLYVSLRNAVLNRQLAAGARLPSTRDLCTSLAISRNTVVNAFDQLIAEGYLESRVGDGTYVTHALPDAHMNVYHHPSPAPVQPSTPQLFSRRFQAIVHSPTGFVEEQGATRPFRTGVPGLAEFPARIWARLLAHQWRHVPSALLGYGSSLGYLPLRQALADYLGAARGVRCTADQILITSGSQDALNLVTLLLLNPGDAVWMEDPGYRGARAALLAAGAIVTPVPVDGEGLDLAAGQQAQPNARMVYVTPSHQYPMGVTMSLTRRLALIDWARQQAAWIIEDDYDSEYRYQGRPLSSLQGLDEAGRVLYIGTFSKVLFPALRLGYLVVPTALVDGLHTVLRTMQHYLPGVEQAVLTDFMVEGHFARHIRQMRLLYGERQQILLDVAGRELGSQLEIGPSEAGLHVTGRLATGLDDLRVSAQALRLGIETPALSTYALRRLEQGGLVLGYAGLTVEQIKAGMRVLRRVLTEVP
jgi:GntR family transcriptional regulator/MocR family aminotransferase